MDCTRGISINTWIRKYKGKWKNLGLQSFDLSTTEAIKRMFQALFDDLGSEKSAEEAGWRTCGEFGISPATQNGLLISRILEKNSGDKVRLNFRDYRIHQQLRETFKVEITQLEYLLEIQRDRVKVKKAQGVLDQSSKIVRQSPESWTYVIALGWWKMLQTSGVPALLDDILNEGFSPQNWAVESVSSCPKLALDVAQNWGKISQFDEAITFLEKQRIRLTEPIALPALPSQDVVNKVEKILKWTEFKEELTEYSVKTLAFFWFVFLILEHVNLLPCSSEYSVRLFDSIRGDLQKLLGKNQEELLRGLEAVAETLTEKGMTWAPEILRFPEVIS